MHQDNAKKGQITTKPLLGEEKITETITRILQSLFTVLDFIQAFQAMYSKDWKQLVVRFGQFGQKRRYTVTTYLSNRLDIYSQKPDSLLHPFIRYSKGRFKDYRKPTE
jgi:hypothetical protein